MTMNCKQFKHVKRVEKKQQFSFNPAEVNYDNNLDYNNEFHPNKTISRDLNLKKMKGLKFTQIAIIVFAVLAKNLIFQHYGWEYDVFSDDFDIVMIIAHIAAVIGIIFGVSFVVGLLKK